ncbi:MAG TPA: hypothetical protein VGN34_21890, partial [Ktedonobacteraceae bacterium]
MNPDPNAYPPRTPGPGQPPPGSYDATQYSPPPPPGGGSGANYPYNPYGQGNPYGAGNPYGSEQPQPGPAAPYNQYTQYAPPPVQPGQNQYPGQFNYPNQPPLSPRPPRSKGRFALLLTLAILVILGGLVTAVAIPAHNNQVNSDATAVAQSQANATTTAAAQVASTAAAIVTATAAASTYTFSANLKLNDSLTDHNSSSNWDTTTNCVFTGGAYHVSEATNNTYNVCFAAQSNFSNFTFETTVKLLKGDIVGLVFRSDKVSGKSYKFLVASDSTDVLFLYKDYGTGTELFSGSNIGWLADQENQIGVVARGNTFDFYVNHKKV